MDVRGVPRQQNASVAIPRGLAAHVGESRDPVRTVDAEVRSVEGGQRVADVA